MSSIRWEYHEKAMRAGAILNKAVKDGKLERPTTCELCGQTPKPTLVKSSNGNHFERPSIVGHHWKGYGEPLEVLWICQRCNVKLSGPQFHNGTMTKEQAREYILNFTYKTHKSQAIKCKDAYMTICGVEIKCGNWAQRGSEYCYHHQPRTLKNP